MNERHDDKVTMISIDRITVVNPRERAQRKFAQIVGNIAKLGLKKPVTVTPKRQPGHEDEYYLVCGQGRLEAYQILGQSEIPAIVINVSREELLLMSLVENLARRQHTTVELAREIVALKDRGYSFQEIARKTDLDVAYVRGIIKLLKMGEERLVQAVDKRQIPLSVAVTIASSDDEEVQKALTEAYEKNELRGKRLLTARRLIEQRRSRGKAIHTGQRRNGKPISSENLLKTYREETTRQRLAIQKSKLCETRLLFIVSAVKQLFGDDNFVNLLRAESLDTLPEFLANRIWGVGE